MTRVQTKMIITSLALSLGGDTLFPSTKPKSDSSHSTETNLKRMERAEAKRLRKAKVRL